MKASSDNRSPSPFSRKYSIQLPLDENIFVDEKFMISELKPRVRNFTLSSKKETISIDDFELKASMNQPLLMNWSTLWKIEKSQ